MYIKRDSGYAGYVYFLDIACVIFSFFVSINIYSNVQAIDMPTYMALMFVLISASLVIDIFTENLRGFLTRGLYAEFTCVVKWMCFSLLIVFAYMFVIKTTAVYSRAIIMTYIFINLLSVYFVRINFKKIITRYYRKSENGTKVTVVTTYKELGAITKAVMKEKNRDFYISNIIVVDGDYKGEAVDGFEITANLTDLKEIMRSEIIDEVFICVGENFEKRNEIITNFREIGATIHIFIKDIGLDFPNMKIEKFVGYTTVTTSNNDISDAKMVQKRLIDVAGALVGLVLTAIISIVLIPIISISSKGSPFYSQIRVGRNGRKFSMYKFRSMYKDADQIKAKLMQQNEMDGFIFKMENDPRITPVGKIIRKTSIDEFPQFWNVLKGDMSLVGTRPPTVDEFERYSLYHKSRLSFKPGITGLWQISGRSDIKNFDEIVKLDNEYIEKWSIALDIKILIKTFSTVIFAKGAK